MGKDGLAGCINKLCMDYCYSFSYPLLYSGCTNSRRIKAICGLEQAPFKIVSQRLGTDVTLDCDCADYMGYHSILVSCKLSQQLVREDEGGGGINSYISQQFYPKYIQGNIVYVVSIIFIVYYMAKHVCFQDYNICIVYKQFVLFVLLMLLWFKINI